VPPQEQNITILNPLTPTLSLNFSLHEPQTLALSNEQAYIKNTLNK